MLTQFRRTPVGRALDSMMFVVIFAAIVRYVWGAFDPAMRSWSLLGVAPVLGVLTYLQASGREAAVATFFLTLGGAGLVFWIAAIATGLLPVARSDVPWVILIVAVPVVCLGIGVQKRRKLQRVAGGRTV